MRFTRSWLAPAASVLLLASAPAFARTTLPPALVMQVDTIARTALAQSGVPSASIAVVQNGQLAYTHAYGDARLEPKTPATTAMRYSIGSISKQFTAAAILMLQQDGKLSLDDKVAKYFPALTDAGHITLRQVLSHTSGYEDFWPQDYVMPEMLQPTTPRFILDTWAKKPLDFAPGADWQYSNTNYVIAASIVRRLTGQTPFEFLTQHVFKPLGMDDVYDNNLHPLPTTDARGYHRYALGPLRPAPKEGVNWLYGMAELSMTPADLAQWDIAMVHQALLHPASWHAMQTEVRLNDGLGSGYGLGVFVGRLDGHRMISHDGEVSGFTAANLVFPDNGMAVVVLTNQDAVDTSGVIAKRLAKALFAQHDMAAGRALAQAKAIFAGLQRGRLDRALFSADANGYFDATALHDYQASLAPLGTPATFKIRAARERGGMQMRSYTVTFARTKLAITTYTLPNGRLEQYIVSAGH
ncbi:MAG: class A beta-lactamase-related serine hydrolase [Rhodanobacteraceae bacterium]|nr:MAG: class A beta-lactamase-related serine hydrolase [Rhodanobacteraceae bacterium]